MAAALKPHGCHASRAWFRVVRQLSVAGMQRRNRNRPFFSFFSSPPSTFFPPFCSSFFGTQNPFFSPPFFSSHPFASAVLFLTLLSSLYYFWMARSCEESPLSKVESYWCWIAERKGGRLEEGGDRGKPERDMPRVSPCIILRSFERKQRPPRGALPLLLCLWAPKNARSTDGIPVTIP